MEVRFDIENIGRGPGFLIEYGIAHEISREGEQGRNPLTVRTIPGRMVISADAKLRPGAAFDVFQISDEDRKSMLRFHKVLYSYGYIRYHDLFGVVRSTGFMFEYLPEHEAPENSSFAICPSNEWWFDREEEGIYQSKNGHNRAHGVPPPPKVTTQARVEEIGHGGG